MAFQPVTTKSWFLLLTTASALVLVGIFEILVRSLPHQFLSPTIGEQAHIDVVYIPANATLLHHERSTLSQKFHKRGLRTLPPFETIALMTFESTLSSTSTRSSRTFFNWSALPPTITIPDPWATLETTQLPTTTPTLDPPSITTSTLANTISLPDPFTSPMFITISTESVITRTTIAPMTTEAESSSSQASIPTSQPQAAPGDFGIQDTYDFCRILDALVKSGSLQPDSLNTLYCEEVYTLAGPRDSNVSLPLIPVEDLPKQQPLCGYFFKFLFDIMLRKFDVSQINESHLCLQKNRHPSEAFLEVLFAVIPAEYGGLYHYIWGAYDGGNCMRHICPGVLTSVQLQWHWDFQGHKAIDGSIPNNTFPATRNMTEFYGLQDTLDFCHYLEPFMNTGNLTEPDYQPYCDKVYSIASNPNTTVSIPDISWADAPPKASICFFFAAFVMERLNRWWQPTEFEKVFLCSYDSGYSLEFLNAIALMLPTEYGNFTGRFNSNACLQFICPYFSAPVAGWYWDVKKGKLVYTKKPPSKRDLLLDSSISRNISDVFGIQDTYDFCRALEPAFTSGNITKPNATVTNYWSYCNNVYNASGPRNSSIQLPLLPWEDVPPNQPVCAYFMKFITKRLEKWWPEDEIDTLHLCYSPAVKPIPIKEFSDILNLIFPMEYGKFALKFVVNDSLARHNCLEYFCGSSSAPGSGWYWDYKLGKAVRIGKGGRSLTIESGDTQNTQQKRSLKSYAHSLSTVSAKDLRQISSNNDATVTHDTTSSDPAGMSSHPLAPSFTSLLLRYLPLILSVAFAVLWWAINNSIQLSRVDYQLSLSDELRRDNTIRGMKSQYLTFIIPVAVRKRQGIAVCSFITSIIAFAILPLLAATSLMFEVTERCMQGDSRELATTFWCTPQLISNVKEIRVAQMVLTIVLSLNLILYDRIKQREKFSSVFTFDIEDTKISVTDNENKMESSC